MVRKIIAVEAVLLALLSIAAAPAGATAAVVWTGDGAPGGVCQTFEDVPDAFEPGPGEQTWHFVLTQPGGAVWTLNASFSDGTSVTNLASAPSPANVRHWYVITDAGATLLAASASTAATGVGGNLVVSHCDVGETTTTTSTTTTSTTTTSTTTTSTSTTSSTTSTTTTSSTTTTTVPAGCLTRTPGFWGNHPFLIQSNDPRSLDLLPLEVCGTTLENVDAGNVFSTTEAICSVGKDGKILGPQLTQLVRQCTAALLNVAASRALEGECLTDFPQLGDLLTGCCGDESVCTGDTVPGFSVGQCINSLDDFNNTVPDTLKFPFRPGPANSRICRAAKRNGVVVSPTP